MRFRRASLAIRMTSLELTHREVRQRMPRLPSLGKDARVNALIGSGHFLSHYYQLCLPPMFLAWQQAFGATYAELGLSMALMSATTAVVQTPIGFLIDRFNA